jgi:Tol biopolymer transport system component
MTRTRLLFLALILTLMVCGCSIDMTTPGKTPTPTIIVARASTSTLPMTQVPVTWAHLNLTGKIVYPSSVMEGDKLTSNLQMLDLLSGEVATIFSASPAWIYYVTISPDAKTLVISYAPPGQPNSSSIRSLYALPLDGSMEPQPLFVPPTPSDRYTQAEWSPDGKYIYYVHYNQEEQPAGQLIEDYDIWRMSYPDGKQEKILEHAFWPRLALDSSQLVYVSLDPESGRNELFVANADGSNPQHIALSGSPIPEIIDAPLFSPDGHSILFSAPEPSQSYQPNFFDRLLGVQVAKAHSVPSDWWSVPVTGGVPSRLTNLHTINLFASISPDGEHIASLSGDGIFVMDLDGSNLTQVVSDSGVHGTVSWIP